MGRKDSVGKSGAANRSRGQVLIFIVLALTMIVALAAIAVDFVFAYTVKVRLVTAVDAAALGAARTLGKGQSEVERVVDLLFEANFPQNFMLSQTVTHSTPTISSPSPGFREVSIRGDVTVPVFFMRMFGYASLPVAASAVAARRDVNVVLVIDRSASLHPTRADAWDEVRDASTYFLNQFDNDADRLAVVSFGSGGNIDFALNSGFKDGDAAANKILTQTVPNSAGTNSPQGLWLGYSELLRVDDGDALNVIVFFTDGQPSGYSNSFPVKTTGTGPKCDTSPKSAAIATSQPAAYFSDVLIFTNPIAGPPPVNGGSTVNDHPTLASCSNLTSNAGNVELLFATNQLLSSWVVSSMAGSKTFSLTAGPYSGVNPADARMYNNNTGSDALFRGQQIHNSAKNLTVNIAQAARQDAGLGGVRIYSIGLGGWGYPADGDFLQRVANDSQAPSGGFFSNEPIGLYVYAPTPAQLHQAFQSVAREIFRLIR